MAKLSKAQVRLLRDALATASASERVRDFRNARTLDSLERLGLVFVYRSLQPMYYDTTRAGDAALLAHITA